MTAKWDIGKVIQHYYSVDILPGPGWRRMRCPEHDDRTASAQINTDKGCWNCFACDIAEDAIEMIKRIEGVREFGRAVAKYEEITGDSGGPVRRGGRQGRDVPDGAGADQLLLGGSRSRRRR